MWRENRWLGYFEHREIVAVHNSGMGCSALEDTEAVTPEYRAYQLFILGQVRLKLRTE